MNWLFIRLSLIYNFFFVFLFRKRIMNIVCMSELNKDCVEKNAELFGASIAESHYDIN